MSARFFGDSAQPLFGFFHAPAIGTRRGTAVVLCYPGPQEYRQSHFVFRSLAQALAAEGHSVLRFDYFGTGDSAGEVRDATLGRWVQDGATAAQELMDLSGARRVSIVGLRIGATVAMKVCQSGVAVDKLVLWDPVVDGAEYLRQLEERETLTLARLSYPQDNDPTPGALLGYVMTNEMRSNIAAITPDSAQFGGPREVCVVGAQGAKTYDALCARARDAGLNACIEIVNDESLADESTIRDTLFARNCVAAIQDCFARGRP